MQWGYSVCLETSKLVFFNTEKCQRYIIFHLHYMYVLCCRNIVNEANFDKTYNCLKETRSFAAVSSYRGKPQT